AINAFNSAESLGPEYKECATTAGSRRKKAIYGLKQAPRCWYLTLHQFLVGIGFERCVKEVCLYIKRVGESKVLLTVYVDDITITGNNNDDIEKACDEIVDWDPRLISINTNGFTTSHRYILSQLSSSHDVTFVQETRFRTPSLHDKVAYHWNRITNHEGLLFFEPPLYPDVPTSVLRYLKGTKSLCLKIDCTGQVGAFQVDANCDADFANSEDRRSISGFLVMFLSCCLSARSRKQTMVTLSTAEAEYIALCDLVKELLWYIELLEELGFPQRSIVVHCDNQSAIAIAKNPGHHERTKHISTKYHFVRDQVEKRRIQLIYCPTKLMIADILTKAIPREQFEILRSKMGLADGPTN
ncbi:hypothetical protein As57867_024010, partial [Aphanomyces stellatus]